MKAQLYSLTVSVDVIHGWDKRILELFVPEAQLSFNVPDLERAIDSWHCFNTAVERYEDESTQAELIGEVDIPDKLVDIMVAYLKQQGELSDCAEWYVNMINSDFKDKKPKTQFELMEEEAERQSKEQEEDQ